MRTIILTIIITMLLAATPAMAQNTVTFSYDASGNRISRQISVSSVKERGNETTDILSLEEKILEDRVIITTDATSETVSIKIADIKEDEHGSVRLYTAAGAILKEVAVADEVTTVILNSYPSGVYILTVSLNSRQHGWKISIR